MHVQAMGGFLLNYLLTTTYVTKHKNLFAKKIRSVCWRLTLNLAISSPYMITNFL